MSTAKIVIVCDGKEISFGFNLYHLFLYHDNQEEFSSEKAKKTDVELFSAGAYRHASIAKKATRIFINNVQIPDISYTKVFDDYGMVIYKSETGYILKAEDSQLSGTKYNQFIHFANEKARRYLELEQSYVNKVATLNKNWITTSFAIMPQDGLFTKKRSRMQQQYDCLAFVLYLDYLNLSSI